MIKYFFSCAAIALSILLASASFEGSGSMTPSSTSTNITEKLFVLLYTPGPAWDHDKPAYEQNYFREHSAHMTRLRKKDMILMGGRYADKGMIILKAKDLSGAQEIVDADSSVANKIFTAELHEFSTFYPGCITE